MDERKSTIETVAIEEKVAVLLENIKESRSFITPYTLGTTLQEIKRTSFRTYKLSP